ncbi:MAG: hypothetical protein A2007_06095 [Verrucomicrobia bacterium GWC2_42_7]|nr:MAG: hypothetical protein A2007_06095 [Verrucomicrobia bacterium GWC2_42_7]
MKTAIPEPEHQNYKALLEETLGIQIRCLALKILLQRLRMLYKTNKQGGYEYAKELYGFLRKNDKLCEEDIKNIFK